MIYVILFLSLLFIGTGFILTEKNAPYLLSGYNTMSKEEQAKFDLESYVPHFRKFHLFLGISFGVIGLALHYFIGENASGIFLGIYPILAYIYFIWSTKHYNVSAKSKRKTNIGIAVMIATLFFVIGLMMFGFKNDPLIVHKDKIELKGSYGETLSKEDITDVQLVEKLPKITMRTNGFALGKINKGYFRTKDGETVKLILNSDKKPYIQITKNNGKKIFFSSKDKSNERLFEDIKNL